MTSALTLTTHQCVFHSYICQGATALNSTGENISIITGGSAGEHCYKQNFSSQVLIFRNERFTLVIL